MHQIKRAFVIKGQQSLKQAQFRGGLQTIAGLGFGRGGAVAKHAQQARARLRDQGLNGGRRAWRGPWR